MRWNPAYVFGPQRRASVIISETNTATGRPLPTSPRSRSEGRLASPSACRVYVLFENAESGAPVQQLLEYRSAGIIGMIVPGADGCGPEGAAGSGRPRLRGSSPSRMRRRAAGSTSMPECRTTLKRFRRTDRGREDRAADRRSRCQCRGRSAADRVTGPPRIRARGPHRTDTFPQSLRLGPHRTRGTSAAAACGARWPRARPPCRSSLLPPAPQVYGVEGVAAYGGRCAPERPGESRPAPATESRDWQPPAPRPALGAALCGRACPMPNPASVLDDFAGWHVRRRAGPRLHLLFFPPLQPLRHPPPPALSCLHRPFPSAASLIPSGHPAPSRPPPLNGRVLRNEPPPDLRERGFDLPDV